MMQKGRILPAALLLLALGAAACSREPAAVAENWRSGRDGLCLAGTEEALRAGLIVYGPGDPNCSLAGPATREGDRLTIKPAGDSRCAVTVMLGEQARIGPRSASCAYYCGPGADFAGRALPRSTTADPIADLAGDPLC